MKNGCLHICGIWWLRWIHKRKWMDLLLWHISMTAWSSVKMVQWLNLRQSNTRSKWRIAIPRWPSCMCLFALLKDSYFGFGCKMHDTDCFEKCRWMLGKSRMHKRLWNGSTSAKTKHCMKNNIGIGLIVGARNNCARTKANWNVENQQTQNKHNSMS